MKKKAGFYWHTHHDILLEYCYDYNERVKYIKEYKPEKEIKTRLKLFKPVKGKLPAEVVKLGKKYVKAWEKFDMVMKRCDKDWEKYDMATKKYVKAWKKFDKSLVKHKSKIEALHKKECPNCSWNGKEIVFKNK